MGDYQPLFWSMFTIFIIGILLPLSITSFVTVEELEIDNFLVSPVINIVENGFTILGKTINPFSWFGETIQDFFIGYLLAFGMIPEIILIPLLILIITGIIYTGVKMLPTT